MRAVRECWLGVLLMCVVALGCGGGSDAHVAEAGDAGAGGRAQGGEAGSAGSSGSVGEAGSAGASGDGGSSGEGGAGGCDEPSLACTGLYADWQTKTVAQGVVEYRPGHELWSDGAQKRRWLALPEGAQIDVSDMNEWVFPVGTKLWKEFQLGGRRIETRLLEKRASDWRMATFRWADDEGSAMEIASGEKNVPGTDGYEIPSRSACGDCHNGRTDKVLGFEALLLASPGASGLSWDALKEGGLVTSSNGNHLAQAAALALPGNAIEQAALGTLHVNCGVACHQPSGIAALKLRVETAEGAAPKSVMGTPAFVTAINVPSPFSPVNGVGGPYFQLRPLDVARSMIAVRAALRDGPGVGYGQQMPPGLTHKVSAAQVQIIESWIMAMTPEAGYPEPAPLALP